MFINPNGQTLEEYYVNDLSQEDLAALWGQEDDLEVVLTDITPEDIIRISREEEE